METKVCTKCQLELPIKKFRKQYNRPNDRVTICYVCSGRRDRATQDKSKERRTKYLQAKKKYKNRWPFYTKICGYRQFDKRNGYLTISQVEARDILCAAQACGYCGLTDSKTFGLDRRNNDDGHHPGNVVVCCEVCNVVLADLPPEVKDILSEGLRRAREAGLLDAYVVPCKREVTRKKRNEARKSI